jgi:hypothetical protein
MNQEASKGMTQEREEELRELKVDLRIWAAARGSGGDDPAVDEFGDAFQEMLDAMLFERERASKIEEGRQVALTAWRSEQAHYAVLKALVEECLDQLEQTATTNKTLMSKALVAQHFNSEGALTDETLTIEASATGMQNTIKKCENLIKRIRKVVGEE